MTEEGAFFSSSPRTEVKERGRIYIADFKKKKKLPASGYRNGRSEMYTERREKRLLYVLDDSYEQLANNSGPSSTTVNTSCSITQQSHSAWLHTQTLTATPRFSQNVHMPDYVSHDHKKKR